MSSLQSEQQIDLTNQDELLISGLDEHNSEQPEADEYGMVSRPISQEDQDELDRTGRLIITLLENAGRTLHEICTESGPRFSQVGKDLQVVAQNTKELLETIRQTAGLISEDENNVNTLKRTEQLLHKIIEQLTDDRREIEHEFKLIRQLDAQLSSCYRINDSLSAITSSFRAIRINMRIQCSSHLIDDELFNDVGEDIDSLARTLARIKTQTRKDVSTSSKNLTELQRVISSDLIQIDKLTTQGRVLVKKALADIGKLLRGTTTMMEEARSRSTIIAHKVNEVIIAIQFHDAMSQRVDHIRHAFDDLIRLRSTTDQHTTTEYLAAAQVILSLQLRQLSHIMAEINIIQKGIIDSFSDIGHEIKGLNSMLIGSRFQAVEIQKFLNDLYSSLHQALLQLCNIFSQDREMIIKINKAGSETKAVAAGFHHILEEVRTMRDETRLQSVNTLIMATNLGEKGRTIQVLAKELNALSNLTTELMTDFEVMALGIEQKVHVLDQDNTMSPHETGEPALQKEIDMIDGMYGEIETNMGDVTNRINSTGRRIDTVRADMKFMSRLDERFSALAQQLEEVCDRLEPWKDKGTRHSAEIEQLIQRYTMEQERLIHMYDQTAADKVEQTEEDIFF